jgi:hypothetical protein
MSRKSKGLRCQDIGNLTPEGPFVPENLSSSPVLLNRRAGLLHPPHSSAEQSLLDAGLHDRRGAFLPRRGPRFNSR